MPDPRSDLDAALDLATRIDLAARLDAGLDGDTHLDPADPLHGFLSLATEIRDALQRPLLTPAERSRIQARAVALAARRRRGLRRAWPQLAHLGSHPAVVGGAAAAVLAVVGLAALRDRRGQSPHPLLGIA
jgi:hypothetical protein